MINAMNIINTPKKRQAVCQIQIQKNPNVNTNKLAEEILPVTIPRQEVPQYKLLNILLYQ